MENEVFEVIRRQNAARLGAMLHEGLSADTLDSEGYSICWRCLESENSECVEVLLRFNPNLNLGHSITRQTPLMLACKRGQTGMVEKLLELGASRTQTDSEGNSVAHYAIYGQCLQCLHLVADGENVHRVNNNGQNPMVLAIQEGYTESVQYLCRQTLNTRFDYQGDHYLSLAARHASHQVLIVLLNAGFPVETINDKGQTALHKACLYERTRNAVVLLEAGANVNQADRYGNTPIHYAAFQESLELCTLLIQYGANFTRPNNEGTSALSMFQALKAIV